MQSALSDQLAKRKIPFIIGIAGDSGSGKTVFSDGIRNILGTDLVRTITMDGYHKENRETRAKSGRLPLDPGANNLDLLVTHLQLLKSGKAADIPQYNHATGDFDQPKTIQPAPIIILEGLHALYSQFFNELDLKIFVDPSRDVKWLWKFARDVAKRGHRAEKLEEEMFAREAAYKQWIDFQKIYADIVIKIFPSQMTRFARYEYIDVLSERFYKLELLIRPSSTPLSTLLLPFDLSSMMSINKPPFLLACTSSRYWGERVVNIHLDGAFSPDTIAALKNHIVKNTRLVIDTVAKKDESYVSSTDIAQLLIAWRFLEAVINKQS